MWIYFCVKTISIIKIVQIMHDFENDTTVSASRFDFYIVLYDCYSDSYECYRNSDFFIL